MSLADYPIESIHLPLHRAAIRITEIISMGGTIFILFVSIGISFDLLLGLSLVTNILGNYFANSLIVALVTVSSAAIFLYKKPKSIWYLKINQPLGLGLCGLIIVLISSFAIFNHIITNPDTISYFSIIDVRTGIIFVLIGLSFITTILKIPHRFHYAQCLAFIALSISLFGFLEYIYRFMSQGVLSQSEQSYLWGSLLFFILCQSTILANPGRGFISLFTTDSQSSKLARLSLIYFGIFPPILGLAIFAAEKVQWLDTQERLALLIVLIMIISVVITWINVKVLYHSEVEHFVMKEALRVNNISLELNMNDLSEKMVELEQAKKAVSAKLDNQQSLTDMVESMS